ncbi:MAG: DUF3267 domain-containing protein [Oscillospiraceae bacterium]|nr:DUF3267 domain-containing protein [Oscillospiraceae bacterium]
MKKQHVYESLPAGYREIESIDLQKNKKLAFIVNAIAVVIAVLMVIPAVGALASSLNLSLSELSDGELRGMLIKLVVLVAGMIVYLILHELVHGITMKIFGTKKVKYGFTGLYAFAGSDDYYDKPSYITIALAPIVVWGIVLLILNITVGHDWFWVVYLIQIINISGAAGDLYVTWKMSKLPPDILVKDIGVSMTVYGK